jgi:hypothetical protein
LKLGLALLVLGIVAYAVYSVTDKPDYSSLYASESGSAQAMLASADIYPKTVYGNNSLQIKMVGATPEHYKYLTVAWYRNTLEIPGESGPSLPSKFVTKGFEIYAEVNLLGPDALDEPVKTLPAHVLNTPPVLNSVRCEYNTRPTDVVSAYVSAGDADGDQLKNVYRWYRNGDLIDGEKRRVLQVHGFRQGDRIELEAMVTDGEDQTAWEKSLAVTIGSDAPLITSVPPEEITPDGHFLYEVKAESPTSATLTFELARAPEGLKIASNGMISWELPDREPGFKKNFDVTVRVLDPSGGEALQDFTIKVDVPEDRGW